MHAKRSRGIWLLAAWLALAPATVQAQQYAPADVNLPIPWGSTRPEDGGVYTAATFTLYRQTNPLKAQTVAVRGFQTSDGTVPADVTTTQLFRLFLIRADNFPGTPPNGFDINTDTLVVDPVTGVPVVIDTFINNDLFTFFQVLRELPPETVTLNTLPPGTFVGSAQRALDVAQLTGQDSYQPGLELTLGYKFADGSAISLNWLYLTEAQYRASASLAPPGGQVGTNLENTFLFSPVYNFPSQFAGADFKINPVSQATANPTPISAQAVFGIWNGASQMDISFRQRVQQWDITYRSPIMQTETYRLSGLVGPRFFWIWEKFKWSTYSIGQDPAGNTITGPEFNADYSVVTSQRMYGAHVGCQQEWYVGHGFSLNLTLEAAAYLNVVKERVGVSTQARYVGLPQLKRSKREFTIVPEGQANFSVMWYPFEFVQLYAGYDLMYFLNTQAARHPIDFDFGQLNPAWTSVNRLFDGFRGGIAFTW